MALAMSLSLSEIAATLNPFSSIGWRGAMKLIESVYWTEYRDTGW